LARKSKCEFAGKISNLPKGKPPHLAEYASPCLYASIPKAVKIIRKL
jgi:hypothetical protein